MSLSAAHQDRMDRKYRHSRHVFDLTRKFFLFGRTRAMTALSLAGAATVLEIGCGTARNIDWMARRFPQARFIAVDISREMLKSAAAKIARRRLQDRVQLVWGDATTLGEIAALPDRMQHILMSYSLSMVPDWRRALDAAIAKLAPGGRLVIVDFGDFHRWPHALGRAAIGSLSRHDAPPCLDLRLALAQRVAQQPLHMSHTWGLGGFYQIAVVERRDDAR